MMGDYVDFTAGAVKVAPPAAVAAAAQLGRIEPQNILIWLSIIYTVGLLIQLLTNNGARWLGLVIKGIQWLRGLFGHGK